MNASRASVGKAIPDWKLALALHDKYNRVRLGYSNLLTSIETDPSFNNTAAKGRLQSCAEAVEAKLEVESFAHDLVLLNLECVISTGPILEGGAKGSCTTAAFSQVSSSCSCTVP